MRKTITKIICVATAVISAAGLALSSGCGNWKTDGVTPDDYTKVTSNGGFAVQTDDYVYFINGTELNTADNTFGTPVKGSVQRISKEDLENRNYTRTQTIVPLVVYATQYEAGIYIYGDRIYYATPSTAKNSTGVVQNSNLEFKSTLLDGSETMSDYYYRAGSPALEYRYVQPQENGPVYLMYAVSESLYGESSAVTNIHSINTETKENTLLAYNVTEYMFDAEDPTNPYVYYTMGVTYYLGSENSEISESYNQLYVARADGTQPKAYDFSYVEDYDAEENPLYVNCGDLVYDGIGAEANANRYNQFNYGYTANSSSPYTVMRGDTTYELSHYKNGTLTFTAEQSGDSSAGLYRIELDDIDSDGNGKVDESWNAITANDTATFNNYRLLITADDNDYTFVTLEGEEWVLYSGEGGLELGKFSGGVIADEFRITESSDEIILTVREETTAAADGEGTVTVPYLYYQLSADNGYGIYRIALSTDPDNYRPNMLPYEEDDYTYSEVRLLDIDVVDSWYSPEFVGNTLLFASETEGMSGYNYIMACDLSSADGNMMSNTQLHEYNEKYEDVKEKISEYSEETNSDGSQAYENLPDALTYAFYTGDEGYLAELIQAYIDVEGEDEEYLYSKRSAEIYLEFCNAEGDWSDYSAEVRTVDGESVHANMQKYYYSLIGRMSESDAEGLLDDFRSSYMQDYPVDNSTWWDKMGTAWQVVFIIAMCVVGLAVLGGAAVLVIWLIRRHKNKGGEEPVSDKRMRVDITDDRDIDVYGEDN